MKYFLWVWVAVSLSCLFTGVVASFDYRKTMCLPAIPKIDDKTFPKNRNACSEHDGILVDEIRMTPKTLDEDCEDEDDSGEFLAIGLHAFSDHRNRSNKIELYLNQACNGRQHCYFHSAPPSPIPIRKDLLDLANDRFKEYLTYVIKYTCNAVRQDTTNNRDVIDMTKNDTLRRPFGTSTLVVQSHQPFDRNCVITATHGTVTIEPLWVSYTVTAGQWDTCVKIFDQGNTPVVNVGCGKGDVRDIRNSAKTLNNVARLRLIGRNGFIWIRVRGSTAYELTCTDETRNNHSPAGQFNRLCISTEEVLKVFPHTGTACMNKYGIFVENIRMAPIPLADDCSNMASTVDLYHYKDAIDKSEAIELGLKQACNGKQHCHIPDYLPSPISAESYDYPYSITFYSYVVQYRCVATQPLDTDIVNAELVLDVSEHFTAYKQTTTATLVLKSNMPFDRKCTITSPSATIYLDPLWVSYNQPLKRWDACLKIYQEAIPEYELGCSNSPIRKSFLYQHRQYFNSATFEIVGDSGFVWLSMSASSAYDLTCGPKNPDHEVTKISSPRPTKVTTQPPDIRSTTTPPRINKTAVVTLPSDTHTNDSSSVIIGITSTIAVVATVIAICLAIYIVYMRRDSAYQRRKLSRRLERQLTQRQHEGQHPRVQSQRQRQQQQQQQAQQACNNDASTYDLYTYMDESDIKGSSTRSKQGARPAVRLPGMAPAGNYSSANSQPGHYATNYSVVQASTTSEGEYNHLGKHKEPSQSSGEGGTYDTVTSTGYAHFNDAQKPTKVIGNFYDG